jgi:vanillate O-demethylase ferredoxin subunit
MKPLIRKYVLPLHRWTALSIGIVILIISATGAAMAFRPQLERAANRDLFTVPACDARLPLDDLVSKALAARPGAKLDYVRVFSATPDAGRIAATMVRYKDDSQTFAYLNPCNGEVVGMRARFGGLFGTLEQIHRFRFMEGGNLVVGSCVIAFVLVLLAGGIALWWPVRGGWKKAFKPDLRLPQPARTMNLHKTIGVYASMILLLSALTGLPLSFEWFRAGVYAVAGSSMPEKAPKIRAEADAKMLPLEELWQRAQSHVPNSAEALLHDPAKAPKKAMEIYMIAQDAPHPNARTMLYLDPYTGATVDFIPYEKNSAGHKLYFWTLSWHMGLVGGVPAQLLLLGGALALLYIGYSGIMMYLRRQARMRANAVLQKSYT